MHSFTRRDGAHAVTEHPKHLEHPLSTPSTLIPMSHVEPESLLDPELVYTAASLREAQKVEALLTTRGVDYVVQVEDLGRTTLFGSVRHGAGFYVSGTQAEYTRGVLREAGYGRRIIAAPVE